MDRARLKTFILVLLLLINLTFLGLIAIDVMQTARLQSEVRAELVRVLDGMGISIDESRIPHGEEQEPYFLSRDIALERRIAAAVLGGYATETDEGGGIFRYVGYGGVGEGEIRSGFFRFQMRDKQLGEDASGRLLEQLELRASSPISYALPDGTVRIYTLLEGGRPIINAQVSFTFSDGYLQEVAGTALWGDAQRYAGRPQLDATTALISLAGHLLETGGVTRFESVEMGYYLLEGAGVLELRPVWIVQTDAGTFSIDRQSGEIR